MSRIQTYTGKWFDVKHPRCEAVDIRDIAHALACSNRFTGHLKHPLSVAQHSYYVSVHSPDNPLYGLLHDASEAYITDIARPVKALLPDYYALEKDVQGCILERFGLSGEMPADVKHADEWLLYHEAVQGLGTLLPEWETLPTEPLTKPLPDVPWNWQTAEQMFLYRYHELTGGLEV